jgi:hypothetical protein
MDIWEPAKLRYYPDDGSNINHFELSESYEKAMSPIFTEFKKSPEDSVRYFRKHLLWTEYIDILDFFEWDPSTNKVKLAKHRDSEKRLRGFSQKMKHILKNYATKSKITQYMKEIMLGLGSVYIIPSKFYDEVYRRLKKDIKRDR